VAHDSAHAQFGAEYERTEKAIGLVEGRPSYLVGTLYKSMKLKPSVLDQFKDALATSAPAEPLDDYTDEEDTLVLEDESGRVELMSSGGELQAASLATGLVVCVAGSLDQTSGRFDVRQWCAPGPAPALPCEAKAGAPGSSKEVSEGAGGKLLLLVSGLELGGVGACSRLPAAMLVDFVAGHFGGQDDVKLASRIARVVVAGNSRAEMPRDELLANSKLSKEAQEKIHGPMREVDALLASLASAVPVDCMPGPKDPAGHWLPQQPLPPCLFPNAARYSSYQRCPNPHEFTMGGELVLGSSGQPLDDLRKFARPQRQPATKESGGGESGGEKSDEVSAGAGVDPGEECVGWLAEMLRWRHMAPTAPDTLDTYPCLASDPFVLDHSPRVFFAGNQKAFAARVVDLGPSGGGGGGGGNQGSGGEQAQCLCVSVPSFAETGEVVLVDPETLEFQTLKFRGLPAQEQAPDTGMDEGN